MITFDRVLKQQHPYRAKHYRGVVNQNGNLRMLNKKHRTATKAAAYTQAVVARYGRVVKASVVGQAQDGGNTNESAGGGVSRS